MINQSIFDVCSKHQNKAKMFFFICSEGRTVSIWLQVYSPFVRELSFQGE